jgi:hypothetical protein
MRRKLIGRRLRMRRKQAGLPMRDPEIIARIGSTRSLQRLEDGESTGLTFPVIGSLCDLYKVPAEEKFELQRLWRLGPDTNWTQPRGRSVFGYHAYRELEVHASRVCEYESTFVPGHLQTERYIRQMFARNPELDEETIETETKRRLRAQVPFWQDNPGQTYRFLVSEAVLRYGCDPAQLDRLVEADSLDHASVKYIPFGSGPPSLLYVSFSLLSFPDGNDPDIVYVEAPDAYLYFEEQESVRYYSMGFETSEDQARSVKEFKL